MTWGLVVGNEFKLAAGFGNQRYAGGSKVGSG
jgi:hypothetical protein